MCMTAKRPSSIAGWRMVVRGGTENRLSSVSSKPVTETSRGTSIPRSAEGADTPDRHQVVGRDYGVYCQARVEEARHLVMRILFGEVAVDELDASLARA